LLAGSQVRVEGPKEIQAKGFGEVVVFAARTP
jgi:hypothetical protein